MAAEPVAPAPVDPGDRLPLVDALRGFALLGIFLVNIGDFALLRTLPPDDRAALPLGSLTRLAEITSLVFVRGKFYTIFAFLFGLGFSMLLLRARARDGDFRSLYRRRLGVLLLIGAAHMALIWYGDILAVYALLGFLLPLFIRTADRGLLWWAAALFAMPTAVRVLVVLSDGALDPGSPLRAASVRLDRALLGEMKPGDELKLLQSGDWLLLVEYNLGRTLFRFADLVSTSRLPRILGAFLLGLWAGRRRVFEDPERHRALLRRVLLWGLAVGLPANGALALLSSRGRPMHDPVRVIEDAVSIGVPALALAYGAAFVLIWLHPFWRGFLAWLAPAGRMALSNYLAQSLIGIFVFYGIGLGLGGRVGSAACAAMAVGVFTLQVAASAVWLDRFRYGPAGVAVALAHVPPVAAAAPAGSLSVSAMSRPCAPQSPP
jgi:uncharacterized protein